MATETVILTFTAYAFIYFAVYRKIRYFGAMLLLLISIGVLAYATTDYEDVIGIILTIGSIGLLIMDWFTDK